ncbi:hypothetical protein L0657_20225 [Dyadobacter sp. CY345]|uniref:catalase-related domain-containing protein n=1 Tax=Dyadobacter sp. CY345 TaxID=2909335 RepID=UPI001F1F46A0|nr:catalase-related domain-containing protein [Dyadobacter sp. CY345]MCF2446296.1 hypothetical protein [Dyadobacter sp. CY345]
MNTITKPEPKVFQEKAKCQDQCLGSCCNSTAEERNTSLLMGLNVANCYSEDDQNFRLSGIFFREMLSAGDRENLVKNIVRAMKRIEGPESEFILKQKIGRFFKIDTKLALDVAYGLNVKISSVLLQ